MSLYKDRLIESLNGFWDEGVDRVCDVADSLERSWHKNKKRARKQAKRSYKDGREKVISLEQSLAESIRRNPSIFIAIGLLLVALIVGKVLMSSGCCSSSKQDAEDW
jgi:hypothetical protein